MTLSVESRERLGDHLGHRPGLLGHIIIELLLDAYLHETRSGKLPEFYQLVESADAGFVQSAVNRMGRRTTENLVRYFEIFLRERYVFDYSDDRRLIYRINRVFERVRLKPIGEELKDWLPKVRQRVYDQANALLPHHVLSDAH